jgi:non-canonical (house-cleaning) NTP pyrophosphatase
MSTERLPTIKVAVGNGDPLYRKAIDSALWQCCPQHGLDHSPVTNDKIPTDKAELIRSEAAMHISARSRAKAALNALLPERENCFGVGIELGLEGKMGEQWLILLVAVAEYRATRGVGVTHHSYSSYSRSIPHYLANKLANERDVDKIIAFLCGDTEDALERLTLLAKDAFRSILPVQASAMLTLVC